jgi:hypothetical protein
MTFDLTILTFFGKWAKTCGHKFNLLNTLKIIIPNTTSFFNVLKINLFVYNNNGKEYLSNFVIENSESYKYKRKDKGSIVIKY